MGTKTVRKQSRDIILRGSCYKYTSSRSLKQLLVLSLSQVLVKFVQLLWKDSKTQFTEKTTCLPFLLGH